MGKGTGKDFKHVFFWSRMTTSALNGLKNKTLTFAAFTEYMT